jgi:hypothetical protein
VLTARNPNEVPIQVDVTGPDVERRVTVEPGETATFPELANGEYTVVTLSAFDENVFRVGEETATVDCETPESPAPSIPAPPVPAPTGPPTPSPTPTATETAAATPTAPSTPTATPAPTGEPIEFVAFCFPADTTATVEIRDVTRDGDAVTRVAYAVTGPPPTNVTHGTAAAVYRRAGDRSGTVVGGVGGLVGRPGPRPPVATCPPGLTALLLGADDIEPGATARFPPTTPTATDTSTPSPSSTATRTRTPTSAPPSSPTPTAAPTAATDPGEPEILDRPPGPP